VAVLVEAIGLVQSPVPHHQNETNEIDRLAEKIIESCTVTRQTYAALIDAVMVYPIAVPTRLTY
jgi:hypothetical protein